MFKIAKKKKKTLQQSLRQFWRNMWGLEHTNCKNWVSRKLPSSTKRRHGSICVNRYSAVAVLWCTYPSTDAAALVLVLWYQSSLRWWEWMLQSQGLWLQYRWCCICCVMYCEIMQQLTQLRKYKCCVSWFLSLRYFILCRPPSWMLEDLTKLPTPTQRGHQVREIIKVVLTVENCQLV